MINRFSFITRAVALLLLLSAQAAMGQGYGGATLDPATFPTLKPQRKTPAPPTFTLDKVREIPIPGPLAGGSMVVDGNRVLVPVNGGYVQVDLTDRDHPVWTEMAGEPPSRADDSGWVLTGRKKRYRFRTEPSGHVVAQKRPSARSAVWKRRWHLKTPGGTPAPPLLVGKALLFGCTDNRVYALKARNGHRLWFQDLGQRVLVPLVHWRGALGPNDHDLILVIPHPARSIRMLDPFDGKSLAGFRLGDGEGQETEDEFASHPAVLADGRIVLPVQKYSSEEAVLLVLQPTVQARKADEGRKMPYNGEDPAGTGSRERRTKTR